MSEITPDTSLPMLMCILLDTQRHRSGLDQFLNINDWLRANHIYKLPEVCYQQMYSIMQTIGTNTQWRLEEAQEKSRKVLADWIAEAHPDKQLSNLCDLRIEEARAIHPQLTWGMYILLLPTNTIPKLTESGNNNNNLNTSRDARILQRHRTPLLPG